MQEQQNLTVDQQGEQLQAKGAIKHPADGGGKEDEVKKGGEIQPSDIIGTPRRGRRQSSKEQQAEVTVKVCMALVAKSSFWTVLNVTTRVI